MNQAMRVKKIWTRGENLEDVEVVFDGDYKKIFSFPFSSIRPDGNYYGILEGPTFFTKVLYLFKDNELVKLDLPLRMDVNGTFKGSLIVSLDEDWRGYSSGSLVAVKIADALENQISDESIELIFAPSDKRFLRGVSLGVMKSMSQLWITLTEKFFTMRKLDQIGARVKSEVLATQSYQYLVLMNGQITCS